MTKVQVSRPAIGPEEEAEVLQVLRSGWVGQGPVVARFEQELAALLGIEHAIAVSSATTGLQLALLALGVGEGDAVIVPDFTFPASANAVRHCGAEPILLDVDLETLNLDLNGLVVFLERHAERRGDALIDSRTGRTIKAIMAVHLFGLPLPMAQLGLIAGQYGLPVVEDAACALGARDNGVWCGTTGDVGCYSFHPRKVITTGEGGLLVTRNADVAAAARTLRNHGMAQGASGIAFTATGYNFRMSDLNAAVGLAQLGKLRAICAHHAAIASWYDEELAGLSALRRPARIEGRIYQAYVVLVEGGRDAVIAHLKAAGIESVRGTYAVSAQPAYAGVERCDRAIYAQDHSLALPLHTGLDRKTIADVCAALKRALAADRA